MAAIGPPGADAGAAARRPALVFAGGAVGALLRHLLVLPTQPPYGPMLATLVVNVAGAFSLGLLVALLVRCVPDLRRREYLTLLLRTGLLGGFTTYSALGLFGAELVGSGQLWPGIAYAIGTVLLGGLATWAGGRLGGRLGPGGPEPRRVRT